MPRPDKSDTSVAVEKPGRKIKRRHWSIVRESCPAIPCSRAADATRAKSMPRPSSLTAICILPPSLKAASLNLPITFLPAAVRSSGLSRPWLTALRTRCRSGSAIASASGLSIAISPTAISNSTSFPNWRAAILPARVATRSSVSASGTSRSLISRSSSSTNRRRRSVVAAVTTSRLSGARAAESALIVSRNNSPASVIIRSSSLSSTRTEAAGSSEVIRRESAGAGSLCRVEAGSIFNLLISIRPSLTARRAISSEITSAA